MSRELEGSISGNLDTGEFNIKGRFNSQFRAPLILKSCEHWVNSRNSSIIRKKKKIWTITTHGNDDGYSQTSKHCEELD